jgi:hypothetical protein
MGILESIGEWFRGLLTDGIIANFTGMFDEVNRECAGISVLPFYLPFVFTAPVSERVCKQAWPPKEAMDYLKRQSGTQFDPELVKVFLWMIENDRRVPDMFRAGKYEQYINPMDISDNYSDDDDPLTLKSDFILSLCELIIGGKAGLEPVEKTVIDRCMRFVYRDYLANPVPERMPILEDLYNLLRKQAEHEVRSDDYHR